MDPTSLTLLSALFVLILGNYGFTFQVLKMLWTLRDNHLKHLTDRVTKLEGRDFPSTD
jgi:hypothetical protein